MTITAALVKELRERTGAGMMECKKALVTTNGDIEQAIDDMRKAGQAKADKKAGRIAAEGMVVAALAANQQYAIMIEINSETDFVARDTNFIEFANAVAKSALAHKISDIDNLERQILSGSELTVEQARQELIAKIGENIKIRRIVAQQTTGVIGAYLHSNRIGVLVNLQGGDQELAKDIAMHIAASRPLVVNPEDVSAEVINKEKEIFAAQALESGKPAEIIEKMIGGRINKFLQEVSLMGQPFVKDPDTKISQLLKQRGAVVESFIRFEVGEGIEKKEDNFVQEVMAQVSGAE